MVFKVFSLLVSDYRLSHLFRSKNYLLLLFSQKYFSARHFRSLPLNKHKSVSSFSGISKMSTSTDSENVFHGKEDRFEGITVFSELEPCDVEEFQGKLKNSLITWKNIKKRAVWFKVHLNQCGWVSILVQNGFKYHHAKEDYVMLYIWLPSDESDNVPNYAHTMVGVGAVVVNDRDQIVVVKERHFYKLPMWKLPGGYVEPGENLVDAAIREVAEETGIEAQFESILSLRHTHFGMFGCSDIYFVVSLKAVSEDISKCDREIAECRWMDIGEYLTHGQVHELNKFVVRKLLHHRRLNIKMDCYHGVHQLLNKPYTVYSIVKKEEADLQENIPRDGPLFFLEGEKSKPS